MTGIYFIVPEFSSHASQHLQYFASSQNTYMQNTYVSIVIPCLKLLSMNIGIVFWFWHLPTKFHFIAETSLMKFFNTSLSLYT